MGCSLGEPPGSTRILELTRQAPEISHLSADPNSYHGSAKGETCSARSPPTLPVPVACLLYFCRLHCPHFLHCLPANLLRMPTPLPFASSTAKSVACPPPPPSFLQSLLSSPLPLVSGTFLFPLLASSIVCLYHSPPPLLLSPLPPLSTYRHCPCCRCRHCLSPARLSFLLSTCLFTGLSIHPPVLSNPSNCLPLSFASTFALTPAFTVILHNYIPSCSPAPCPPPVPARLPVPLLT